MYPGDIGAAANTTAGGGMADGRTMTTSIASSSLATDGYKLMAIDVLDHRGVDAAAAAPGSGSDH